VRLSPLALTTVIEDEAQVFGYQLEVQGRRTLNLRVDASGEAGRSALQRAEVALRRFLQAQGLGDVVLVGRCGCAVAPSRSGKTPRVRRQAAA
jgi:hypothetical protein